MKYLASKYTCYFVLLSGMITPFLYTSDPQLKMFTGIPIKGGPSQFEAFLDEIQNTAVPNEKSLQSLRQRATTIKSSAPVQCHDMLDLAVGDSEARAKLNSIQQSALKANIIKMVAFRKLHPEAATNIARDYLGEGAQAFVAQAGTRKTSEAGEFSEGGKVFRHVKPEEVVKGAKQEKPESTIRVEEVPEGESFETPPGELGTERLIEYKPLLEIGWHPEEKEKIPYIVPETPHASSGITKPAPPAHVGLHKTKPFKPAEEKAQLAEEAARLAEETKNKEIEAISNEIKATLQQFITKEYAVPPTYKKILESTYKMLSGAHLSTLPITIQNVHAHVAKAMENQELADILAPIVGEIKVDVEALAEKIAALPQNIVHNIIQQQHLTKAHADISAQAEKAFAYVLVMFDALLHSAYQNREASAVGTFGSWIGVSESTATKQKRVTSVLNSLTTPIITAIEIFNKTPGEFFTSEARNAFNQSKFDVAQILFNETDLYKKIGAADVYIYAQTSPMVINSLHKKDYTKLVNDLLTSMKAPVIVESPEPEVVHTAEELEQIQESRTELQSIVKYIKENFADEQGIQKTSDNPPSGAMIAALLELWDHQLSLLNLDAETEDDRKLVQEAQAVLNIEDELLEIFNKKYYIDANAPEERDELSGAYETALKIESIINKMDTVWPTNLTRIKTADFQRCIAEIKELEEMLASLNTFADANNVALTDPAWLKRFQGRRILYQQEFDKRIASTVKPVPKPVPAPEPVKTEPAPAPEQPKKVEPISSSAKATADKPAEKEFVPIKQVTPEPVVEPEEVASPTPPEPVEPKESEEAQAAKKITAQLTEIKRKIEQAPSITAKELNDWSSEIREILIDPADTQNRDLSESVYDLLEKKRAETQAKEQEQTDASAGKTLGLILDKIKAATANLETTDINTTYDSMIQKKKLAEFLAAYTDINTTKIKAIKKNEAEQPEAPLSATAFERYKKEFTNAFTDYFTKLIAPVLLDAKHDEITIRDLHIKVFDEPQNIATWSTVPATVMSSEAATLLAKSLQKVQAAGITLQLLELDTVLAALCASFDAFVKALYAGERMTENVISATGGSIETYLDLITQGINTFGYIDTFVNTYQDALTQETRDAYDGSIFDITTLLPDLMTPVEPEEGVEPAEEAALSYEYASTVANMVTLGTLEILIKDGITPNHRKEYTQILTSWYEAVAAQKDIATIKTAKAEDLSPDELTARLAELEKLKDSMSDEEYEELKKEAEEQLDILKLASSKLDKIFADFEIALKTATEKLETKKPTVTKVDFEKPYTDAVNLIGVKEALKAVYNPKLETMISSYKKYITATVIGLTAKKLNRLHAVMYDKEQRKKMYDPGMRKKTTRFEILSPVTIDKIAEMLTQLKNKALFGDDADADYKQTESKTLQHALFTGYAYILVAYDALEASLYDDFSTTEKITEWVKYFVGLGGQALYENNLDAINKLFDILEDARLLYFTELITPFFNGGTTAHNQKLNYEAGTFNVVSFGLEKITDEDGTYIYARQKIPRIYKDESIVLMKNGIRGNHIWLSDMTKKDPTGHENYEYQKESWKKVLESIYQKELLEKKQQEVKMRIKETILGLPIDDRTLETMHKGGMLIKLLSEAESKYANGKGHAIFMKFMEQLQDNFYNEELNTYLEDLNKNGLIDQGIQKLLTDTLACLCAAFDAVMFWAYNTISKEQLSDTDRNNMHNAFRALIPKITSLIDDLRKNEYLSEEIKKEYDKKQFAVAERTDATIRRPHTDYKSYRYQVGTEPAALIALAKGTSLEAVNVPLLTDKEGKPITLLINDKHKKEYYQINKDWWEALDRMGTKKQKPATQPSSITTPVTPKAQETEQATSSMQPVSLFKNFPGRQSEQTPQALPGTTLEGESLKPKPITPPGKKPKKRTIISPKITVEEL
jgi:hypothetical protein